MKTTTKRCPVCGGVAFCQPRCRTSSPQVKYYERTLWHLRIMRDLASSQERRHHWAQEVTTVERKLDAALIDNQATAA